MKFEIQYWRREGSEMGGTVWASTEELLIERVRSCVKDGAIRIEIVATDGRNPIVSSSGVNGPGWRT